MKDWDASRYHRVSAPQLDWGQRVIARLQPRPGEHVLDLGCGTGRLTAMIAGQISEGRVVGLDRSSAMLTVARGTADANGARTVYVRGDGAALPFNGVFDAVFSAATLHWIHGHDRVFGGVFRSLRPAGRFVAQCGGAGNLDRLLTRAATIMSTTPYVDYFRDWREPWHFADPQVTAQRLRTAGFIDVETSLEPAPVAFEGAAEFAEFIAVVCVRHHRERLPEDFAEEFTRQLTVAAGTDTPPFVLDYQRLNIDARKPRE